MADEDFQIDPTPDPAARDIIARNARWAEMFGAGSTNLAQRNRYQEDISRERGMRALENEQAFNNRLATDKDFRDLYFRDQNAKLQNARITHEMDLRQQKFQMDQERFPLQMENERTRLKLQEANLDHAVNREARDAANAIRVDQQTENFEQGVQSMIEAGTNPHAREYVEGMARLYAKNPHANKSVVDRMFKSSGIDVDPTKFQQTVSQLNGDYDITMSEGPNGRTLTARPKRVERSGPDTLRQDERSLDSLRAKLNDPKYQGEDFQDYRDYITKRIGDVESRLKGGSEAARSLGDETASIGAAGGAASEAASVAGKAEASPLAFDNDPQGLAKAAAEAPAGTVFIYNGKKYQKPGAK